MKNAITLFYISAAVASVLTAMILRRRRHAPEERWLTLMVLLSGLWALGDAIELQASTPDAKRFASQIQYLATVSVAPVFLYAALALSHIKKRIRGWMIPAVWGVPILTLLIAWTSAWHDLLWTSIEIPDPGTGIGLYHYGWWFWVFALHSYALLVVASLVLVVATQRVARAFRLPLTSVLFAVLLPAAGNIAYIMKLGPVEGIDWFGISILLSGTVLAWATSQRGLLDILPRAREALVERMQDGVILSDERDQLIYSNDAATVLLAGFIDADEKVPAELLEVAKSGAQTAGDPQSRHAEVALLSGTHWLDVRVDPIRDRWNEVAGRIWIVRDITTRKTLEAEKDTLLAELETALGTVRTLEGILPICSGCRKIREEDESWSPIDTYVRRHTGVAFSHSLCPDCVERLYGEHLK
jgi:PAS domain-containing protein